MAVAGGRQRGQAARGGDRTASVVSRPTKQQSSRWVGPREKKKLASIRFGPIYCIKLCLFCCSKRGYKSELEPWVMAHLAHVRPWRRQTTAPARRKEETHEKMKIRAKPQNRRSIPKTYRYLIELTDLVVAAAAGVAAIGDESRSSSLRTLIFHKFLFF